MSRLAMPLLALSALLFVLGLAAASNPFMLASVAAAIAMLVMLMLGDRDERATSTPTPKAVPLDSAADATSLDADDTAMLEDVTVQELLTRVGGLGPRRVEMLAEAFASSAALRAASKDELTMIPGVGPATAERIMAGLTA
jgi:predicted flap endonuclease-1-like 5' DNA nuclease